MEMIQECYDGSLLALFGIDVPIRPLWLLWTLITTGVLLCGSVLLYLPHMVPKLLGALYKYGKAKDVDLPISCYIDVPKRWFYHFYLFAIPYVCYIVWTIFKVYFLNEQPPKLLLFILDLFLANCRTAQVNSEDVFLVSILLMLQVFRRFYECYWVSVFSPEAKMTIIHYAIGYFFYFGVGLTLLAEAPGFTGRQEKTTFDFQKYSWHHLFAVAVYLWAFRVQYKSLQILAELRRKSNGAAVTYQYSMPKGYWFDVVSCPHYLAEITIYVSMLVILGVQVAKSWWFLMYWVVVNQINAALMSHQWYMHKFDDYPKQRKAIFPYLL